MKEALIAAGPTVTLTDTPIPVPEPDQVLIRVVVSGTNPKDWKVPQWANVTSNQGDDIAGVVSAVGADVTEFKPGDRVAAFHQMMQPGGSYAEYAIAWQHTTFHLPVGVSFEEAATIPLAAMTSAVALYQHLHLPPPWQSPQTTSPTPLIIYGGASAIGAYAIQLATKSNIHPIIAIAGRGIPFVNTLLDPSKGDRVIDYRAGDDAVVSGIKAALAESGHSEVKYAYDAVSEKGSYVNLSKVLAPGGKIALVLPGKKYPEIPETLEKRIVSVGQVHGEAHDQDFGYVFFRLIAKGLRDGWFKPHPHEVVPGGLGGLQLALSNLRDGKNSGVKYVVRIAETEGVDVSKI